MSTNGLLGQLCREQSTSVQVSLARPSLQPLHQVYQLTDGVWTGFGSQIWKIMEKSSLKIEAGVRGCWAQKESRNEGQSGEWKHTGQVVSAQDGLWLFMAQSTQGPVCPTTSLQ